MNTHSQFFGDLDPIVLANLCVQFHQNPELFYLIGVPIMMIDPWVAISQPFDSAFICAAFVIRRIRYLTDAVNANRWAVQLHPTFSAMTRQSKPSVLLSRSMSGGSEIPCCLNRLSAQQLSGQLEGLTDVFVALMQTTAYFPRAPTGLILGVLLSSLHRVLRLSTQKEVGSNLLGCKVVLFIC